MCLAEQTELRRRRVALGVSKPRKDSREVSARFEAGASAAGGPRFVLELLEGSRIPDHWSRHELSTRRRAQVAPLLRCALHLPPRRSRQSANLISGQPLVARMRRISQREGIPICLTASLIALLIQGVLSNATLTT